MKEISEHAGLATIYTNHQIRKTTATGMYRSGFSLEQISHVTKHKNLDSLKHYVSGPSHADKENYNQGLFSYTSHENTPKNTPKRASNIPLPTNSKKQAIENIEVNETNRIVPASETSDAVNSMDVRNVVMNQLQQAPNLFANAIFNNCNFNFTLPQ